MNTRFTRVPPYRSVKDRTFPTIGLQAPGEKRSPKAGAMARLTMRSQFASWKSTLCVVLILGVAVVIGLKTRPPAPRGGNSALCVLSPDASRGRAWAPTCKGCHDIASTRPERPSGGPNLHDVYGSAAGTESIKYEYQYHPPLIAARAAGIIWSEENLYKYLEGPREFLENATGKQFNPASYMTFFIGGDTAEQVRARRDVIAYLRAIKGQSCD